MAKKSSTPPSPARPELTIPRAEARAKLEARIQKGSDLLGHLAEPGRLDEYEKWQTYNGELLRAIFTSDQPAHDYEWCTGPVSAFFGETAYEVLERQHSDLQNQIKNLESVIERLELYPAPPSEAPTPSPPKSPNRTPLDVLERLVNRFHLVVQQLRRRHGGRDTLDVKDEYDVQDLLHALLRLEFDDVRPEEHTPSYAGGASRMDFLLKKEQIVVEVKHTRSGLGAKEIGDQLLIDMARYRSHLDCKMLVCFVYDPDARVANPRGLESDLEQHANTWVRIRP